MRYTRGSTGPILPTTSYGRRDMTRVVLWGQSPAVGIYNMQVYVVQRKPRSSALATASHHSFAHHSYHTTPLSTLLHIQKSTPTDNTSHRTTLTYIYFHRKHATRMQLPTAPSHQHSAASSHQLPSTWLGSLLQGQHPPQARPASLRVGLIKWAQDPFSGAEVGVGVGVSIGGAKARLRHVPSDKRRQVALDGEVGNTRYLQCRDVILAFG